MDDLTEVELHLCYPSPFARKIDDGVAKALAASIDEIGLKSPITVRRVIKSRAGQMSPAYEVLAGLHRVKAFRRLGRETIPAFVVELDDLRAELTLIDENLCRNELTPAERAAAVARRKRIYIELHPETKHGAGTGGHSGRSKLEVANFATSSLEQSAERFTTSTAAATGRSERAVQLDAHRGEALGEDALRVARTSLDKGDELDALAKMTPEKRAVLIERAAAGEKVSAKTEVKKGLRDDRERILAARQQALPALKAGAVVADPAWRLEPRSRDTGLDRAADNHYPTMALDDIKALDVASIADDDCVLFLWATAPMLPQALEVMAAWGFVYRSHVIWAKDRIGTGYWFKNRHELLLVGVRGNVPAPAMGTQFPSVIEAPVGKHSSKPQIFLELVERYFLHLPKIELNRRGPARPGWAAWGNEAEGDVAAAPAAPPEADAAPAWWAEALRMRGDGARIFDIAARFSKSTSTVHQALEKMQAHRTAPASSSERP